MAFGIITMKKISGSLGGILSHVLREHESRTNPDIDSSKSANNYSLIIDSIEKPTIKDLNQKIYDRIKSLPGLTTKKGKKRKLCKNAIKLADFVITASPEAIPDDPSVIDHYFRDALMFLQDYYGKENIMYAEVHLDEATPHLHVGIVPVVVDEKGNEKLCARELFTRNSLKALQDNYYEAVSCRYGLDKPIGGRKGLNLREFKGMTPKVQSFLKSAIFERIEASIRSGEKEQLKTAEAVLHYTRDKVPEEWLNDWFWLTELEKDAKKNQLGEDRY